MHKAASASVVAVLFGVFSLPTFVGAATAASAPTVPPPSFVPQSAQVPDGLTSCFEHYRFGSVPVRISGNLLSAAEGANISFSGTIQNQNTYSLSGLSVYAKIFKVDPSGVKNVDGPDVADFFVAVPNINLKAGETKPISFVWSIPKDAEPGSYQVVTYVVQDGRFNYSGLSFTNDVVGSSLNFMVVGDAVGASRFTTSGITVNGQPFHAAAFPPRVASTTKSVVVKAIAANTGRTPFSGSISWSLYYWDDLQESHLIDSKTEELKMHPKSSNAVSYITSDTAHSVYYLVGALTTAGGSKSLISVRFVREGVNEPRINSIGIDPYPAGGNATAFVCAHSTGTGAADDTRLSFSVSRAGIMGLFGAIASANYVGVIPGSINALAAPLKNASGEYILTAKLYQHDALVDSVSVPFCTDGTNSCVNNNELILAGAGLTVLLFVVVSGFLAVRRKGRPNAPGVSSPSSPSTSL